METLIILSIVQSAFLYLLLLSKKDRSESNTLLGEWLLLMMLNQFYFLLIYFYADIVALELLLILSAFPLLSGPIFFFYVASLTGSGLKYKWLHFIPFIVFPVAVFFLRDDIQIDSGFIMSKSGGYQFFYHYYGYLFAAIPLIYVIASFGLLKKYSIKLQNQFSNHEKINLRWLRLWLLTAIVFLVFSFPSVYLATSFELFDRSISFKLISAFNTIYIFVVGYFGFKQTTIFSDVSLTATQDIKKEKYAKSGLDEDLANKYQEQLDNLMSEENLFLEANLKAKDLAEKLGTSVHVLSQVLNQYAGKTFYQYMNDQRVNEVIRLMKEKQNDNISSEGLAYQSGFNARSTFIKAFKAKTGQSPTVFRKNLSEPIG